MCLASGSGPNSFGDKSAFNYKWGLIATVFYPDMTEILLKKVESHFKSSSLSGSIVVK